LIQVNARGVQAGDAQGRNCRVITAAGNCGTMTGHAGRDDPDDEKHLRERKAGVTRGDGRRRI
jgi:hypothetical protein